MENYFDDYCYSAYAFNNAAKATTVAIKLGKKGNITEKFNDTPYVVNSMLTVELAFKAILIKQGITVDKIPHTHCTVSLYNKLSPKHKGKIKELVKAHMEDLTDEKFIYLLSQHSDYFVCLRYPDELYGKEINDNFVCNLRSSCIEYIHQLQNEN